MSWIVKSTQVLRGSDNQLSIRRLLVLFFCVGMLRYQERMFFINIEPKSDVLFNYGIIICIVAGIITADNLIKWSKTNKNEDNDAN